MSKKRTDWTRNPYSPGTNENASTSECLNMTVCFRGPKNGMTAKEAGIRLVSSEPRS